MPQTAAELSGAFALYHRNLCVSNSSTDLKGGRFSARSSFGLVVKLLFSGGCSQFRSKEVNKRAIKTVATTNLKLGGRPQFWFSCVWMRLEILSKFLAVQGLQGLELAGRCLLLKF